MSDNADRDFEALLRRHLGEMHAAPAPPPWTALLGTQRPARSRTAAIAAAAAGLAGLAAVAVLVGALFLTGGPYGAVVPPTSPETLSPAAPSPSPLATEQASPTPTVTAPPPTIPTSFAPQTPAATPATTPLPRCEPMPTTTPAPDQTFVASAEALERAKQTALDDPRLVEYLAANDHCAPEAATYVYPPSMQRKTNAIIVTVKFTSLVDDAFPLGSCDIGRPVDRVSGVAWLIDETGREILAVTPIWPPDIDCFG